ncbi:TnsA-like heteromeric transposase endonuclease subunit [Streptomyces sindenensis]|uniref:TnsA-like heteromeric transposase endonuclease subunit n=1 Tax=Streptomyces sindenensis TaxID=67363 RepID=A0ABW6EI85_9ACTN
MFEQGGAEEPSDVVWSDQCAWTDLIAQVQVTAGRSALDLSDDWARRWTVTWRTGAGEVSCAVRDLNGMVVSGRPMRRFSWRRDQRHRPNLQAMVSTGRLHGAESLEEARVLLALDFAGDVVEVASQPFRLRFDAGADRRSHIPDFLAMTRWGWWLIDVRPAALVREADVVAFAATAEAALACGWRCAVVGGWRDNAFAALDAFSSHRRPLSDPLGLRPALLAAAEEGLTFGELAAGSGCEPVARAQLLHLLWRRRIGVDLRHPLTDASPVRVGAGG